VQYWFRARRARPKPDPPQAVSSPQVLRCSPVLTISRLSRWSIAYYEKTADKAKQAAMGRQAAGGGLGEYYGEGDTRAPTWIVVGDAARVAALTGLSAAAVAGGFAQGDEVTAWLDDGVAPNGA